jgi:cytoskeletal protein RodZ
MGVIAALQGAENLTVEPGRDTTCELTLSNTGSIVEQFSIMVLGDAVAWIRADPPVVSMFPGAQQTVTLHFAPPRDHTTLAGELPFAIKVIPSNEPEESVTEEGVIHVGSFNDLGAELLPRNPTGRVLGRQRLAVDSRGNMPLPVAMSALDASDALRFRFRPALLTAAPGAAHFVHIRIRPHKRFWKGPQQLKPYKVTVSAEGERPLVLDGQFTQRAVLPKWVYALVALIVAAVLIWFFILKPAVHDTAVNANKAALTAAQTAAANAQKQANSANSAANSANSKANQAIAAATGKKVPATTTTSTTSTTLAKAKPVTVAATPTTLPPPVTSPTDGRLEAVAAPGSTALTQTVMIPAGTTLTLSDLILQNISGSSGTARIQRLVPNQPAQDLLVENLTNLKDQEYTFNTPIVFTHDQQMQLRVDCSGNQTACDVGVYYTGPVTQPQSATTTTIP